MIYRKAEVARVVNGKLYGFDIFIIKVSYLVLVRFNTGAFKQHFCKLLSVVA